MLGDVVNKQMRKEENKNKKVVRKEYLGEK